MAPRAYWKGYLKLSLVSCPVALFPASSEREKISFNQINKKTGNRIRYRKIDAETGDEVDSSEIIKGYEVGKGQYIEVAPEELEAIAIESKRTIEIDEFVPKQETTSSNACLMDGLCARAAPCLASAALCRYMSVRRDIQGEHWKRGKSLRASPLPNIAREHLGLELHWPSSDSSRASRLWGVQSARAS